MPYVERNPAPPSDPRSLKAYVHAYIEHLKVRNYATQSVQYKRASLIWFPGLVQGTRYRAHPGDHPAGVAALSTPSLSRRWP